MRSVYPLMLCIWFFFSSPRPHRLWGPRMLLSDWYGG